MVDTASLIERRRQILLNTPHLTSASANPLTLQTDISANLKDCKIYFEPVQEGTGDPSPENVRSISGWDGVTVAKNWFAKIDNYEVSVNGVTFTRNPENGIVTIKGKATAMIQRAFSGAFVANGDNFIFQNFPVLSGGLYWYVWDGTSSSVIRNNILNLNGVKLKPTSGHQFSIAINITKNATVDFTFKPVIYDETEAITIPFPQTIYGGYVDLVDGEVVETWRKETFGSTGWTFADSSRSNSVFRKIISSRKPTNVNTPSDIVCDSYKDYKTSPTTLINEIPDNSICGRSTYGTIFVRDNRYSTVEDFVNNMSGVEFAYKLATPITHQLTPQVIKTLKGTNNIWSDANGNIEVKFWKH